jgi:hypothetical protein
MYNIIKKNNSFTFYEGTIWDDRYGISAALCNMNFDYEEESFIFFRMEDTNY